MPWTSTPKLASGRYAVIADEAHSSQTGSSASKLKQILGSNALEGEEISAEELLDAAVHRPAHQPSRGCDGPGGGVKQMTPDQFYPDGHGPL